MVEDINFKRYVLELAKKGMRADGRKFTDFREPITIEYDISKNAEGSARVTIGKTLVVCGVKMAIGEPYPDQPDKGSLIVSAEFAPISSPDFEPGAPGEESIELARIVDRGIRESGAIDLKRLCIKEGEKMWMAMIDIYIQNHDGNLIDAAALAAIAALLKAKFPKYNAEKECADYSEHTNEKVPMLHKPIAISFSKVGEYTFVDSTDEEEKVEDAKITIITDEEGNINGIQKSGYGGMSEEEINNCVEIALHKAAELRKHLK